MLEIATVIAFAVLCLVVIIAAVMDLKTGLVPNRLTYPAMLGGVLFWTIIGAIEGGLTGAWIGWQWGFGGLLVGLVPYMILVFVFGGLGGGDAKLMGSVGAISASWQCVVATSIYAMAIALVMALWIMFRQGLVRQTLQRLWGAFLIAGARGKPKLTHEDSPRIAFAFAIAVGAVISGVELMLGIALPWTGWM